MVFLPTQSPEKIIRALKEDNISPSFFDTGRKEYRKSLPKGLSKWDARITLAPRFTKYSIVGMADLIL
jgi:hypothetical protein